VQEITPELVKAYGLSEDSGILIVSIQPGGIADRNGLAKGDVIKEINRTPVKTLDSFYEALDKASDENILLLVKRNRTAYWVVVKQKK
jgi:serine protease Do